MEKNFLSLIKTRRSVRAYKSEPVPSKALDAVLEAGTYAPTGGGHQSPTIIAITDPKYRREIFDSESGKNLLREWKLTETLRGVGAIALGYPVQEVGQPTARKQNYIVRIICGKEGKHADQ